VHPEGITVAGQRRIRTGFAGLCAILGYPRTGVQYRSPGRLRTARTGARLLSPWVAGAGPLLPLPGSGLRCHKAAVCSSRAKAPGPRAAADG